MRHQTREAGETLTPEEIRKQAVRQALEKHPELADKSDSASLARLSTYIEAEERALQVQLERVEAQRREFAEAARRAGEESRRVRKEQQERELAAQRQKQEAERLRATRERELQEAAKRAQREAELEQMTATRRWFAQHRTPLLVVTAVVVVLAVIGSALAIGNALETQRLAELAQEAAEQEAANNRLLQEKRADALVACDPQQAPRYPGDAELMNAWVDCEDASARRAVAATAGNGILTPASLEALASDTSGQVREVVAAREDLPADLETILATDTEATVRAAVASRVRLGEAALEELISDTDRVVLRALAKRGRIVKEEDKLRYAASANYAPFIDPLFRSACEYPVDSAALLEDSSWEGLSEPLDQIEGLTTSRPDGGLLHLFGGYDCGVYWYRSNPRGDTSDTWKRFGDNVVIYSGDEPTWVVYELDGRRLINGQTFRGDGSQPSGDQYLPTSLSRVKWCNPYDRGSGC